MKTILVVGALLLLCIASDVWSAVTVTCDDCTFTPVYSYLVTKNGEPVEKKVVDLWLVDDNLAESHGLSVKM